MSESEFWNTDLRHLFNRINGFQDLREIQERSAWQRTLMLFNIQVEKNDRVTVDDLFAEPKEAPRRLTPKELDEKFGKLDRWMKKQHGTK